MKKVYISDKTEMVLASLDNIDINHDLYDSFYEVEAPEDFHVHVYEDATVHDSAEVYGNAVAYGYSTIFCNAKVYDNAQVFGGAMVYNNAQVFGNATVDSAVIRGNAKVSGDSQIQDGAAVYGNAVVTGTTVVRNGQYIAEAKEDTEGMQSFTEQDILDAIDKQFGQRNVYMWSTYILPNGHFLNPEKSEQSGNLTYEHADFDNWVDDIFGSEGIRVLDRNSIKMNVTYPYLYLPEERITANQVLAIRQVLSKKDEFEYAVYDIADNTDNPNVLELLEPILIQTKNDDAVFDLSYQSTSDIIKAISRYYSLGTFLNESKGLNEGLSNNKQRGMAMERKSESLTTMEISRVGYRNNELFGSPSRLYTAIDIVKHEYNDLGNTDIADTMFLFGLIESAKIKHVIKFIKTLQEESNQTYYGVWLCATPKDVVDSYWISGSEGGRVTKESVLQDTKGYHIPDEAIAISDLGQYGVLWITPHRRLTELYLNEGLINNKQRDTIMEREEKDTITLRVRVGYVNTGYFGEDYFETEEEYTEQVADMEAARQLLEEEYGNIFNIVTKHNGDIVAWVY